MNAYQKRIVGFALKNRLPSIYFRKELWMPVASCPTGRTDADSYRRVAYYVGQNPEGSQACRSPGGAADEV